MKAKLILPSLLHFLTDFVSVYVTMRLGVSPDMLAYLIVSYDSLAFFPQPMMGALLEKRKSNQLWASLGCASVCLGAILPLVPVLSVILLGLGNSLFHVAEGDIVVRKSKKSYPLGVFIACGSIGLGIALTFTNVYLLISMLLVYVILAILNCFVDYEKEEDFKMESEDRKGLVLPAILIALGVFVRGFLGPYNNQSWGSAVTYPALYSALAIFAGKAIGGFILDLIGPIPLISISLVLSLLGLFFPGNMWVCLLGIVGVNLLMALTMDFVRRALPEEPAFGFGLLAACLMLGYFVGAASSSNYFLWLAILFAVFNAASLIFVSVSLHKKQRLSFLPRRGKA